MTIIQNENKIEPIEKDELKFVSSNCCCFQGRSLAYKDEFLWNDAQVVDKP